MTTNFLKDASNGHATPAGVAQTRKSANRLTLGGCNFALSLLLTLAASNPAVAGPEGGQVVGGDATIDQNGRLTQIFQGSDRVAINWDTFNVGLDETVRFIQPSSTSVALNHIFDQNASQIFGAIDANGVIFLINPNGLVFGANAQVNVASLIASSLNISTADFMAGNYTFEAAAGAEGGLVLNQGNIVAAEGGFVALLGQAVANEGLIVADAGTINLASGNKIALDFDGGGLLFFEVQSDVLQSALGQDSAVSNSGSLIANGGQVLLTARAAQDVYTNAINNEGLIQAQRIDNQGGVIRLLGNSGDVLTTGVLDASGAGSSDTGGTVQVLGERVAVYGDASIDVSGDNGGGLVQIGGSFQGADSDVQSASRTYVGPNAQINADARVSGDGGEVVVWADQVTRYYGDISARGGDQGGNGGSVEVSGKDNLIFAGNVDTSAPQGQMGSLLLDPADIVISNAVDGDGADDGLIGGADGTVLFADAPAGTATISQGALEALPSTTNVSLQATNSIVIQDLTNLGIADDTLTLAADGSVEFLAGAGGFSMNTGDTINVTGTGSLTIDTIGTSSGGTGNGAITTGAIQTNGGNVSLNGTNVNVSGAVATSGGDFLANSGSIANFDSSGVLIDTTGAADTAGGAVSITTTALLTTGGITTSGGADIADLAGQDAGAVTLTGGTITAGVITSTGSAATTGTNPDGADGTVTLSATAGLSVQDIDAANVSLRVDADDNSAETLALAGTITSSGTVTLAGSNTNANDTLSASNAANEWVVSSANTGTLNTQAFNDFANLTGGTSTDNFTVSGTGSLTGTAAGGTGANSLTANNTANTWALSGTNAGSVTNTNGTVAFTGVQNVTGGSAADNFTVSGTGSLAGTANGAGGANSLTGANTANAWALNAANAGSVTNTNGTVAFTNVQTVTGGTLVDTMTLGTADYTGTVNGGAGDDDITVNVAQTGSVNGGDNNDTVRLNAAVTGGVTGGAGTDTIVGNATANAFVVNAGNEGTVNATTTFTGVENLTGGAGADTFAVTGTGSLSGTAAGAGGANSLTANNTANAWALSGSNAGSVTNTNGTVAFTGVQNVTGGSAADNFTVGAAGSLAGTANGAGGANSLTGANTANAWALSAEQCRIGDQHQRDGSLYQCADRHRWHPGGYHDPGYGGLYRYGQRRCG